MTWRKAETAAAMAAAATFTVGVPAPAAAGAAGVATEWTQLLNYGELANLTSMEASHLSIAGEQLSTEVEQLQNLILAYRNMVQNTERLPSSFHRQALDPILDLRRLYMRAGSLAGSGRELDAFLRSGQIEDPTFDAEGYSRTDYVERYDAWQDRWRSALTSSLATADLTVEDVETEARLLDRLSERADQADGNLAALQVANELSGSLARQVLDLRALQAAQAEQTTIAWARVLDEMDVKEAMQRRHDEVLAGHVQRHQQYQPRDIHELLGIGQ